MDVEKGGNASDTGERTLEKFHANQNKKVDVHLSYSEANKSTVIFMK